MATTKSRTSSTSRTAGGRRRSRAAGAARAAAAQPLPDFLAGAGTLSHADRLVIVDQALILLEQNYAHLPLKQAMHAVNPVQRLRVLRNLLEHTDNDTMDPEWQFHAAMSAIFHSVRDLHTNYLLPAPFAGKIAYPAVRDRKMH